MEVVFRDGFYIVSRYTGPTHNMLAIRYGQSDAPVIQPYPDVPSGVLDEDEVLEFVLDGVVQARGEVGKKYSVEIIRYRPDDSGPSSVYSPLARFLTLAVHDGRFEHVISKRD